VIKDRRGNQPCLRLDRLARRGSLGKKNPASVIHKIKGGMGVEVISFLSGEKLYRILCDELVLQRGE